MAIIDFAEPEKVNPYTDDVANLIIAGDGKGVEYTIPTKEFGSLRRLFAEAANDQGKTARVRVNEPGAEDGTTHIVFTLTAKHAPRIRKPKTEAAPVEAEPEELPSK